MKRHGFTIIEVIIVVGLIGLLSVALLPRIGGGSSRALGEGAAEVEADLRYAAQRAVATGRLVRWTLDLDSQTFRIEEALPVDEEPEAPAFALPTHSGLLDLAPPRPDVEFVPLENRTGEWRWLDPDGVLLEALHVGDDEIDEGTASVAFAGDGGAEPAEVWLSDKFGYRVAVRVLAFTGEVRRSEEVAP